MQSVNNNSRRETRSQIARLAAITLVFSYAELLIPRILPFFRLGLGNAAMLMGLGLPFSSFVLLSVIKSLAANVMSGTLFSPFFIVSLAQSVLSALVMFALSRAGTCSDRKDKVRSPLFSIFGISVSGSAVSALVQISLSSLYLGQGTWSLLGPILLFNVVSGLITAGLAETLNRGGGSLPLAPASSASPAVAFATPSSGGPAPRNAPLKTSCKAPQKICFLILLFIVSVAVFFINNVYVLCAILFLSLIAQKISGRKILFFPHLSLWIFVMISSVLVPNGRIIFSVAGFSITGGALHTGIQKALRLSAVSALSQCAVKIEPEKNTLLGLTLNYYKLMLDSFGKTQGSIFTRLRVALSTEQVQQSEPKQNQKEEK